MLFEWDPEKELANGKKHGVSFHEAATVFADPFAITFADPDHSEVEERSLTLGFSNRSRLLIVAHTTRPAGLRIISARPTTRVERRLYEEA